MQPFTSPVGRYAFGSITSAQENKNGQKEFLVGLVVDEQESKTLFAAVDNEIKERQSRKQWPEVPPQNTLMPFKPSMAKLDDGSRVPEEGKLLWIFRRKEIITVRGEQKLQSAPQVWDGGGLNITKNCPDIGYGSDLRVFFQPYAYNNMSVGVKLDLLGVQIVKLQESKSMTGFTPGKVEGAYQAPEEMQPGKSLEEMFEGSTFEPD